MTDTQERTLPQTISWGTQTLRLVKRLRLKNSRTRLLQGMPCRITQVFWNLEHSESLGSQLKSPPSLWTCNHVPITACMSGNPAPFRSQLFILTYIFTPKFSQVVFPFPSKSYWLFPFPPAASPVHTASSM